MKLNRFEFVILFVLSLIVVQNQFILADMERGFNATGGEVFILALPMTLIYFRLQTVKKSKQSKKKHSTR